MHHRSCALIARARVLVCICAQDIHGAPPTQSASMSTSSQSQSSPAERPSLSIQQHHPDKRGGSAGSERALGVVQETGSERAWDDVQEGGAGGGGGRWGADADYTAGSGDAPQETPSRGRVRGVGTGAEEVVVERLGGEEEDGEVLAARNRAEALYMQLYGDAVGEEGSNASSSACCSASSVSRTMHLGKVE